jgi:hypothetical protein
MGFFVRSGGPCHRPAATCHNAPVRARHDRIKSIKKTERHSVLSVHSPTGDFSMSRQTERSSATSLGRTVLASSTKPKLRVIQGPVTCRESSYLENQICDLDRAARIAFLMMMHDAENKEDESLGLFAVEQVERLASELRASFYTAMDGKSVQS